MEKSDKIALLLIGIIILIIISFQLYVKNSTYSKMDWKNVAPYQIEYIAIYDSQDSPFIIIGDKKNNFLEMAVTHPSIFHDIYKEDTVKVYVKFMKVSRVSTSGFSRRYSDYRAIFYVDNYLVDDLKELKSEHVEDILKELNR